MADIGLVLQAMAIGKARADQRRAAEAAERQRREQEYQQRRGLMDYENQLAMNRDQLGFTQQERMANLNRGFAVEDRNFNREASVADREDSQAFQNQTLDRTQTFQSRENALSRGHDLNLEGVRHRYGLDELAQKNLYDVENREDTQQFDYQQGVRQRQHDKDQAWRNFKYEGQLIPERTKQAIAQAVAIARATAPIQEQQAQNDFNRQIWRDQQNAALDFHYSTQGSGGKPLSTDDILAIQKQDWKDFLAATPQFPHKQEAYALEAEIKSLESMLHQTIKTTPAYQIDTDETVQSLRNQIGEKRARLSKLQGYAENNRRKFIQEHSGPLYDPSRNAPGLQGGRIQPMKSPIGPLPPVAVGVPPGVLAQPLPVITEEEERKANAAAKAQKKKPQRSGGTMGNLFP